MYAEAFRRLSEMAVYGSAARALINQARPTKRPARDAIRGGSVPQQAAGQEHTMSLCYREQRQLRGIQAGLFRSDSHLAGMLDVFGRLYRGQDVPAPEQVRSGHGRDRRAVTRIAAAFAAMVLAISVLISAAVALPPRSGAPVSGHRPPGPSAPGQAGKPAVSSTLPDRTAGRPVDGS